VTISRSLSGPCFSRTKVDKPRTNDKRVMNNILYVLTTGCKWTDIKHRHYSTALRRLKRWQKEGVKILEPLISCSKLSLL
jgi:transposase